MQGRLEECTTNDLAAASRAESESVSHSAMSSSVPMTPWSVAHQAPLPHEFSKQEHWSGLPCPPPEDLPNPGIEPGSPALQVDSLPPELPGKHSRAEGKTIKPQQSDDVFF